MSKWQKNLTQRGQLQSWFEKLPPEQQDLFLAKVMPIVYGQKNVDELFVQTKEEKQQVGEQPTNAVSNEPIYAEMEDEDGFKVKVEEKQQVGEQPTNAVSNETNEPIYAEMEDEDGFKVKVNISPLVQKIRDQMLKEMQPVLKQAMQSQEIPVLKQAMQSQEMLQKQSEEAGVKMVEDFLQKHPDFSVQYEKGKLRDALEMIAKAGPTHPEYNKLQRIRTLAQFAIENGVTLEDAYKTFYGEFEEQKKMINKIKKNQKSVMQEKPGKTAPPKTPDEEFEEAILRQEGIR